ncbi:MAG: hypothetical protein LBQ59_01355 [Candidatus Peribacteria bacterium]|jgi:hypothetical protein|nr:hypothetical protein [Candidatus Peribacteria bacterium]
MTLSQALEYLQKRNFKNNLIFVLTDDMDLIDDRNLKLLSFSNEIIYFNIFDYFENNLENLNVNLSLNNGNNFLNISLNDKEKVENFRKERQILIKNFQNFLKNNRISYKVFDTKENIFKELYLFFNKEKSKIL